MAAPKRKASEESEANVDDELTDANKAKKKQKKLARTTSSPSNDRRSARTVANAPSREAVFNTAELLENISLRLPAEKVFGMQRLCRQFSDIVTTSPRLQRKLLIRAPDTQTTERWALVRYGTPPWLARRKLVRIGVDDPMPSCSPATPIYTVATCYNSLFMPHQDHLDLDYAARLGKHSESLRYTRETKEARNLLGPASWKNTYWADRSCKKACIEITWSIAASPRRSGTIKGLVSTDKPEGFSVSALIDTVMEQKAIHIAYVGHSKFSIMRYSPNSWLKEVQAMEEETGRKAVIEDMSVAMHDVLLPGAEGRGLKEG